MRPGRKQGNPVIDAIRHHLAMAEPVAQALPNVLPRKAGSTDIIQQFATNVESVGGECTVVSDYSAAVEHIAQLATSKQLHNVIRSDGPLVTNMVDDVGSDLTVANVVEDRESLFAVDAGITEAQWAIAETGTLVLASGSERHRLTSLVPPLHVALLPASRIVTTMADVLDELATSHRQHHAVTFVTGPSRTADIELTLVVGVHGPKELHVVVLLNDHIR